MKGNQLTRTRHGDRCHRFCNHHLQFHVYRTETKLAAMADYVRGTIFYVSTQSLREDQSQRD